MYIYIYSTPARGDFSSQRIIYVMHFFRRTGCQTNSPVASDVRHIDAYVMSLFYVYLQITLHMFPYALILVP